MASELQLDVDGWRSFLREWDVQARELLLRLPGAREDSLLEEFWERDSILRDGATEEALDRAASRIGRELPESLRRFYRASNGLTVPVLDAEHARIVAVEHLAYLRDNEPWLITEREANRIDMPDEEYRRYGRAQNPLRIPSKYFRELVQLCPIVDSAVLALNPEVRTSNGEWEAWHMGFQAPGTMRYPTFESMMLELREQTIRRLKTIVH